MAYSRLDINDINSRYSSAAFTYQQRRHGDWTTNYTLYRDKIPYNRLTQRQSVNIPLMKYIVKSALKEVDDPVDLFFRNRDNDKQKEVFFNEYWREVRRDQKIDVRDIGDKKQVMQYGRSTTDWNIENGKIIFELDDPFDIFFDQFTDPYDIDGTCNFMEHRHIYKALSSLQNNPKYSKIGVAKVKEFYATQAGLVKSGQNTQSMAEKNQRLADMGVTNVADPEVGETYVEISKRWTRLWNDEYQEMCIYYSVSCEGETLFFDTQENVIGETTDHYWRTHFIKTSWADDVERNDIYSDGLCDMIRPLNVIVNAEFSQEIENRTLKNFSMQYYDTLNGDFIPQSFEATPWGWYPVPVGQGKTLKDVIMPVPVGDLSDNLAQINWIMGIAEKAAATSPTQSGQVNQSKVTLGEIELVLQEAKDRLKTMSNYYIPAWQERGTKFVKLIEAAGDRIDAVKSFKKGYKGNMFSMEFGPNDWFTPSGYDVEVTSKADNRAKSIETINTLNAVKTAMPGNVPLQEIYEQKMLDLVPDLTPEQVQLVTDFQKKQRSMQENMPPAMMGTPGSNPGMNGGAPPMALPATAGQPQQLGA